MGRPRVAGDRPRLFWFVTMLRWIPLFVLDFGYQAFAKRRYRFFGKYDACHVPTASERARFLEAEQPGA